MKKQSKKHEAKESKAHEKSESKDFEKKEDMGMVTDKADMTMAQSPYREANKLGKALNKVFKRK